MNPEVTQLTSQNPHSIHLSTFGLTIGSGLKFLIKQSGSSLKITWLVSSTSDQLSGYQKLFARFTEETGIAGDIIATDYSEVYSKLQAMIAVLRARPDIQAVLDVTHPEPPDAGSPLYSLPNVVLTPHIAGSMEGECRRMGRYMVDELRRFVTGEPLKWQITRERAALLA